MGEYEWLVFPIAPRPSGLKLSIYKTVRSYNIIVLDLKSLGLSGVWILSLEIRSPGSGMALLGGAGRLRTLLSYASAYALMYPACILIQTTILFHAVCSYKPYSHLSHLGSYEAVKDDPRNM
jgi:hypothetical protein